MLIDTEGNQICLADKPNGHILIMGSSGQGKTFLCCRRMEKELEEGRKTLVIDYSGSYTEQELRKQKMDKVREWREFNMYTTPYFHLVKEADTKRFIKNISDILAACLEVRSYRQKQLLQKAVSNYFNLRSALNFADLYDVLEELWISENSKDNNADNIKALEKLLARFEIYSDLANLYIRRTDDEGKKQNFLTLIQLSDFPEYQRRFLTEFLLSLIWKETIANGRCRFCTIFLDEIQQLSMKKGGILYSLLQEGRKFGISMVLSTQFISRYRAEERDALMQAGNIFLFKPTMREIRMYAGMIDSSNKEQWSRIVNGLRIGEAVLLGQYGLQGHERKYRDPVICRIH